MIKIIFLLFFLISCASVEQSGPSEPKLISDFIQQWKSDYEHSDETYLNSYRNYLFSVHKILKEYQLEHKFEGYLTSIKNTSQLMTHAEFNLPQRFKKEKRRRWANEKSEEYKLFKEKILGELHDRLTQERWDKLEIELGSTVFNKLLENKKLFTHQNQEGFVNFPL